MSLFRPWALFDWGSRVWALFGWGPPPPLWTEGQKLWKHYLCIKLCTCALKSSQLEYWMHISCCKAKMCSCSEGGVLSQNVPLSGEILSPKSADALSRGGLLSQKVIMPREVLSREVFVPEGDGVLRQGVLISGTIPSVNKRKDRHTKNITLNSGQRFFLVFAHLERNFVIYWTIETI